MQSHRFPSLGARSRVRRPASLARPFRALTALLLALTTFPGLAMVQAEPLPGPNTQVVRPTSWGAVRGYVMDARTRRPLAGARVRIEEEGSFASSGPTTALCDTGGRYTARARIGRSWSKIDWMRVFTSFPLLLALQPRSAMKQSRTILATRMNLRVEREGYLPFVGEVDAERLDAGKFAIQLNDVWLAPAGAGLVSFSPDQLQHEAVESFTVEPAVARPGEPVTITARARIPFERGSRYRVYFDSSEPGLIKGEQRLQPAGPPDPKTGISTFRREVRLPKAPKVWTTELSPWISRDYKEIPVGWEYKTLLQVLHDEKERPAAQQVADGFGRLADRNPGAAAEVLRRATVSATGYAPAFRYLGEAFQETGRDDEAAAAYQRLVELTPDDLEVALPRYAEALLDSGHVEAAAKALDAVAQKPNKVPAMVALARARLLARRGDLRAADEQLARAGKGGRIPRSVQREIALRRAEAALRATPESPDAELALTRALADLDRLEEAQRHARRACTLRPDEPWPLVELAALERRLDHDERARAELERALALDPNNADASLSLAELLLTSGPVARARELFGHAAERRPFDFRVRHGLALAELRMAAQALDARRQTPVKTSGEQPAEASSSASRLPPRACAAALEQLRVAAVIGRGKGELDTGFEVPFGLFTTLYFGPKRQTIEGFTRRQAVDDYQLVRALERLQAHPDDALAQFSAGTALARLGQPDLALASLDRAAALQPEIAEIGYWRGVALLGLHRPAEARQALEEAVRRNPLHPHARRLLARLCLDAGETEQAQAHLAAHRRQWPSERRPAPEFEE